MTSQPDPGAGQARPSPMFPLGTVLFPGQPLPLHVFEPRYQALTVDCLRNNPEFGVVLIERGHEVGGGDSRFSVGTTARIVEAARLPEGRWGLLTVGERRIRVRTWLPDDPYPVALVEELDADRLGEGARPAVREAERLVRRCLAMAWELGETATAPSTFELPEDPDQALWGLCARAPVGPMDRQSLLECPGAQERLELLSFLVGQVADVLAQRLAEG